MNAKLVTVILSLLLTGMSFGGILPDWFPLAVGIHWEYNVSGVIIFNERIYSVSGERTVSVTEIMQQENGYPIFKVEECTVLSGIPTQSGDDMATTEVLYYHVKQDSILVYVSHGLEEIHNVFLSTGVDTGTSSWTCSSKTGVCSNSIRYLPYSRSLTLPCGNIERPVSILTEIFDSTGILTSSSVEYFGWHIGPVLIYEDIYITDRSDFRMQLIVRLRNKYKN